MVNVLFSTAQENTLLFMTNDSSQIADRSYQDLFEVWIDVPQKKGTHGASHAAMRTRRTTGTVRSGRARAPGDHPRYSGDARAYRRSTSDNGTAGRSWARRWYQWLVLCLVRRSRKNQPKTKSRR